MYLAYSGPPLVGQPFMVEVIAVERTKTATARFRRSPSSVGRRLTCCG
jgi:hypothetical protein